MIIEFFVDVIFFHKVNNLRLIERKQRLRKTLPLVVAGFDVLFFTEPIKLLPFSGSAWRDTPPVCLVEGFITRGMRGNLLRGPVATLARHFFLVRSVPRSISAPSLPNSVFACFQHIAPVQSGCALYVSHAASQNIICINVGVVFSLGFHSVHPTLRSISESNSTEITFIGPPHFWIYAKYNMERIRDSLRAQVSGVATLLRLDCSIFTAPEGVARLIQPIRSLIARPC